MDLSSLFQFIAERQESLWLRTGEHLMLAGLSTLIAAVAGIAVGIACLNRSKLKACVLSLVGILQTVPSLAMLVFLMAVYKQIGVLPALTALTLYAHLPIVRNTVTGLESIDPALIEAAEGIGMTELQHLLKVRLPLAAPVIIAGVRTAAVVGIGVATLAAFIGAGGLGEFINRGLALSNTRLILLGAVPAAILALIVDFSLAAVEWGLKPLSQNSFVKSRKLQKRLKFACLLLPFILVLLSSYVYLSAHLPGSSERIRIGSKHFSEQIIIAEMLAQLIETKTRLKVDRRFDFAGTLFCHEALLNGQLDIYPEYTGTALTAVLHEKVPADPSIVYALVANEYEKRWGICWLKAFGFNNTWVLITRKDLAEKKHWKTISDLTTMAGQLNAGLTGEFAEREDGYPGLQKAYSLEFGHVQDLDTNIVYKAVADSQVDLGSANATDGRIAAYNLVVLKDNKHFFPPYEAAPIVSKEVLKKHPELEATLNSLAGKLSNEVMSSLNYEVDGKKRSPKEVVREFLQKAAI